MQLLVANRTSRIKKRSGVKHALELELHHGSDGSPFLASWLAAVAAARLASLLSWLARSFCFFLLLLLLLSSAPLCARLRLASPGTELLLLLLAIFNHLPLTGRLSLTSLPPAEPLSLGSESELRRFLPGPAILAALLLPEKNRVVLKSEQGSSHVRVSQ